MALARRGCRADRKLLAAPAHRWEATRAGVVIDAKGRASKPQCFYASDWRRAIQPRLH
jgi:hypothetical protein